MPTGYPGRAGDWDLGGGHSLAWDGAALMERHTYGPAGGWHGFVIDLDVGGMLAGGGPGDEEHLTIAVPLQCPSCGVAGQVRDGRWVPA